MGRRGEGIPICRRNDTDVGHCPPDIARYARAVRNEDGEERLLFQTRQLVWLRNKKKNGENPRFQAKFVDHCEVKEFFENHIYRLEKQEQESIQK